MFIKITIYYHIYKIKDVKKYVTVKWGTDSPYKEWSDRLVSQVILKDEIVRQRLNTGLNLTAKEDHCNYARKKKKEIYLLAHIQKITTYKRQT